MVAEYDGSGDEGYINAWTCWKGDEEVPEQEISKDVELGKVIEDEICELLGKLPFDWVNNEGGFGTASIDVVTGQVTVDNSERHIETIESSHEVQL